MPKTPASRTRRSKTEVQKEFSKIFDEAAGQKASSSRDEQAESLEQAEIRQAVDGLSVEGVIQNISGLGLSISRSLGELSERLVQEVEKLNAVRAAVELEKQELQRLHQIDISATALDMLMQDYRTRKEELESEISAQRAAWEAEEQQRNLEQKEFDDALRKQRQREAEEFEYKKALERRKAQDKYDEDQRTLEKKNKERQEGLEKSWQTREAELKAQEEEWARLRKESEEFPTRLRKECEAAVKAALQAAEQRHEQQVLILNKEAEAERRLAEQQIKSLQENLQRQATEIEALRAELGEAKRQVQDIAVKAIEGASGAKALSHVNQIAIEQAKHRTPQG